MRRGLPTACKLRVRPNARLCLGKWSPRQTRVMKARKLSASELCMAGIGWVEALILAQPAAAQHP